MSDELQNGKIKNLNIYILLCLIFIISLYLFEGIIGLPVFSGTPEKGIGLIYFTGPTMGYLIGFLSAGFLASKINFQKLFTLVSNSYFSSFAIIFLILFVILHSYN